MLEPVYKYLYENNTQQMVIRGDLNDNNASFNIILLKYFLL